MSLTLGWVWPQNGFYHWYALIHLWEEFTCDKPEKYIVGSQTYFYLYRLGNYAEAERNVAICVLDIFWVRIQKCPIFNCLSK